MNAMMSGELAAAVSRLMSEGFQMEPEAFSYLLEVSLEIDLESTLSTAMERKTTDRVIRKQDILEALPEEVRGQQQQIDRPIENVPTDIEVLSDPTNQIAPIEADEGFKRLFQDRYNRLLEIAKRRPDSKNISSVENAKETKAKGLKIAGLLSARNSRKGGVEIILEDLSGSAKVQCEEDVASAALAMPFDSLIIADVFQDRGGQLHAKELLSPDIPSRRPSGATHRAYAILLSDLHVGSKMFLEEDFLRFLAWLNGRLGDNEIVKRIKYVVIAGDIIDGIGCYPGQEYQLAERNLKRQYELAASLLKQIPVHMKLLMGPGNHDPVRQALPQPAIPVDIAGSLYSLENAIHIGSPAYVKLQGVTFLVYHGRSLDDVIATVPDLTYDRPAAAMQVLLKSRHLAPMYGKRTPISPEVKDMLVIDEVPDVFHAGHVHTVDILHYRGTLIVNSGTFQAQTPFQANMGLDPICSIVPIVDLSTMDVMKRSFAKQSFGDLHQS